MQTPVDITQILFKYKSTRLLHGTFTVLSLTSLSTNQETSLILWIASGHYGVNKSLPLDTISPKAQPHTPFKIHFSISL